MKLKLAVVTLWGEDVDRMIAFYRDVLGLPLLMIDQGRFHFDFGGGYLVVLRGRSLGCDDTTQLRFPVLAFAVDDLDAFVRRLDSQGVETPWGIEEDEDSRWVMFKDPGGNLLEVAMFGVNKHRM